MIKSHNNIGFFEFIYLWLHIQGLKVPKHQRRMAKWLEHVCDNASERRGLLMAFRNSGKSTIVGLFCAWVLFRHNSLRILVLAADYALAKKMVRNVKRIIEQHPLTKGYRNRTGRSFDGRRDRYDLCKGDPILCYYGWPECGYRIYPHLRRRI